MNDLKDFFKKANRKRSRGPVKTYAVFKGPAVTTGTYFIKRTIPLVVLAGTKWNTTGPAVPPLDIHANDDRDPNA